MNKSDYLNVIIPPAYRPVSDTQRIEAGLLRYSVPRLITLSMLPIRE